MTATQPSVVQAPAAIDTETFLIDTDVHEALTRPDDLWPYLDEHWHTHLGQGKRKESGRVYLPYPGAPYPTPGLAAGRDDWRMKDDDPGGTLDAMRRQLLEDEGVSIGILNGFVHPSFMKGQFEYAEALTRAYNQWQIEHWLDREPRLRGSVHVAVQDPVSAAREIDRIGDHPQIVQVFIPLVTDRELGDPYYRPIYEAALRHDLVITLHHGGGTETVFGYPRYWLE